MTSQDEKIIQERQFTRRPYKQPVEFNLKENQGALSGSLSSDLSPGGIKLTLNSFVPLHTEMILNFRLGEKVKCTTGRVVWVRQKPYTEHCEVGLEFTDLFTKENIKEHISQFLNTGM